MDKAALARLFYQEIVKIEGNAELDRAAKIVASQRLLQALFVQATRAERLRFSTLFARIAYAGHKYRLGKRLQYHIHHFRRCAPAPEEESQALLSGYKVLCESIQALLGATPPEDFPIDIPKDWPAAHTPAEIRAFRPLARVVLLGDDPGAECFEARDEEQPHETIRVRYGLPERNENFLASVELARKIFRFPLIANLLDVEIDVEGDYRPRAFVLAPDYLVDVTAVAESAGNGPAGPWQHLLKRFLPKPVNRYLLLGHIANFFLDELLGDPGISFAELFPRVFQLNPLAFCLMSDREILDIRQSAQSHYVVLREAIARDFPAEGILPEGSYLEPSFYSERYGLQGRLDLLYRDEKRAAIVELKSGQPFLPNIHGIGHSHYMQTLLYDLLIRSAFGAQVDPANYILYSSQKERPLRFAPRAPAQQYEALQIRNHLVALEYLLAGIDASGEDLLGQTQRIFARLHPERFPQIKGFARDALARFAEVYERLDPQERKYFGAFTGFIAREHLLAKTGVQGVERLNGQAALWRSELTEKQERFEILSHLAIVDNQAKADEPLIVFRFTEKTNELANFRRGDIAVLYPFDPDGPSPTANQVFKCTILALDAHSATVRLRSRQFNDEVFQRHELWNLEPDLLDSGFQALYRGLFDFALSSKGKRDLLLGRRPPQAAEVPVLPRVAELTNEQQEIYARMIAAPEYFLLWGPPGTGKTSVMLRYMVKYLLENTEENLLLLAYTNRAVDEICEAIETIGEYTRALYLRIGSRYATPERFQEQLLNAKTAGAGSRAALITAIDACRVVVATVASITAKPELLQLKSFERVIIDEASQVLEPLLMGFLPHFPRFVLIGDHKQLPAVVAQDSRDALVADEELRALGLPGLGNSLFERLYKRCVQQGWRHAYALLSAQGRMHQDIMAFPNRYFYEGILRILPPSTTWYQRQIAPLPFAPPANVSIEERLLCRLRRRRVVFLSTPADSGATQKINRHEANLVGELVEAFRRLYRDGERPFHPGVLGVITPYRAQIAQIRKALEERGIAPDELTIDTVERYQGGARDIILISLCTNAVGQFESLVSLSEEGVDRKLNVALTRAREHLVILGNRELLRQHPIYEALVGFLEGQE